MRERTLLDLRAMRDGGRLTPTFDDVINGFEAARSWSWRGNTHINKAKIDEELAIRCIEDACRKRMAQFGKDYDALKSGAPNWEDGKKAASPPRET